MIDVKNDKLLSKACSVEGCERKRHAKGYCTKHYRRVKQYGDPTVNQCRKHGESMASAEYVAWQNMIRRCSNPSHPEWPNYGARGIKVYEPWRSDYSAFLNHIGRRPTPNHSLDRYPNNDGNYEPGNVRWATNREQAANTRRNRLITLNGKTQILSAWAIELGAAIGSIQRRLRLGIPLDRPYTGKRITIASNCSVCGGIILPCQKWAGRCRRCYEYKRRNGRDKTL